MNWFLMNISIWNKFFLSKDFLVFVSSFIFRLTVFVKFYFNHFLFNWIFLNKILLNYNFFKKCVLNSNWTPLFKRSSYISFLTFLKRFVKKK